MFHPSDISFAISWSNLAPGWGLWRVILDKPTDTEAISVIPPGADLPVFFIRRTAAHVVLERHPPGGDRSELGRFHTLRDALLSLCPLSDDAREEIYMKLERDFPRDRDD